MAEAYGLTEAAPGKPVFNRTIALKDTWAKVERKQGGKS